MARLAIVAWYSILPNRYGGQQAVHSMWKVAAVQHEVYCIGTLVDVTVTKPNNYIPIFAGSKRELFSIKTYQKLRKVILDKKIDVVIIEHPYLAWICWLIQFVHPIKWGIHAHNIEWERFKNQSAKGWRLLKLYEGWAFKKAHFSIWLNAHERDWAVQSWKLDLSKSLHLLPLMSPKPLIASAKETICKTHQMNSTDTVVLFSGTLDYLPNAKAVEWIYDSIAPSLVTKKDVQILITGRLQKNEFQYLKKLQHPQVHYIGEVDDVDAYMQAADVFIIPILDSSGVKLKLLQALSNHTPVIAFKSAAHGVPLKHIDQAIRIIEDGNTAAFIEAILNAPKKPIKIDMQLWKKMNPEYQSEQLSAII